MWFTTESTVPMGFHLGNRVCPTWLLIGGALDCSCCYGLSVWVRFLWRATFWFNSWSTVPWITCRELFKMDDNINGLLGLIQDTFLSILGQSSNGSKWVCFRKLLACNVGVYIRASRRPRQFQILFYFSLFTFHLSLRLLKLNEALEIVLVGNDLGLVSEWSKCSFSISSILWNLDCGTGNTGEAESP